MTDENVVVTDVTLPVFKAIEFATDEMYENDHMSDGRRGRRKGDRKGGVVFSLRGVMSC